MYCPKCKIDVGNDEFCENCGASTVGDRKSVMKGAAETAATAEVATGQGINIKIPTFSLKGIILLGLAVVVLITGIIGYNKLKATYAPDKVAKSYGQYLVDGNTDKAFSLLDLTETKFLNKDTYKRYIDGFDLKGKTVDVRPSTQDTHDLKLGGNAGDVKFYEVQIGQDVYSFSLVKSGKAYGIFPKWKIVSSDFIKPWEITSPKGSKVFVDGVEITKVKKGQSNSVFALSGSKYEYESVIFVVDGVFPGEYELSGTMPGADELKAKVKANVDKTMLFDPSADILKQLTDVASSFLKINFADPDKGKYDGIVSPDSSFLKDKSNNTFNVYHWDNGQVKKLASLEVDKENIHFYDESHIKLRFNANVSITSDKITNFFTGEKTQETTESKRPYDMTFIKQDGKWLVFDPGVLY